MNSTPSTSTSDSTGSPLPRVVVGVDGSPASIDAIRWAVRYAQQTGAVVEAVSSWDVPSANGAGLGTGFDSHETDWAEVTAESQDIALEQALPGHSGPIKRTVVWDRPATALLAAAEGAELLVVGSRGHGGVAGMLLGSVSAHVVAHAICPVVVIHHQRNIALHSQAGSAAVDSGGTPIGDGAEAGGRVEIGDRDGRPAPETAAEAAEILRGR